MRTPARRFAVLGSLLLALGACTPVGTGEAGSSAATSSSSAGSSATSAPTTGPEDAVAAALARLDRRAQIAQLFVAGVRLEELSVGEALARSGVGGIFLAGRSDAAAADLAATVTGVAVHRARPRPLGGRGSGGRRRPDAPGSGLRAAAVGAGAGRAAARRARRAGRPHGGLAARAPA